jgi:hypothetical protein
VIAALEGDDHELEGELLDVLRRRGALLDGSGTAEAAELDNTPDREAKG